MTLVLDNARYHHNQAMKDKAKSLGIELLFLPGYSLNLNLVDRRFGVMAWEGGGDVFGYVDGGASVGEVGVGFPTRVRRSAR